MANSPPPLHVKGSAHLAHALTALEFIQFLLHFGALVFGALDFFLFLFFVSSAINLQECLILSLFFTLSSISSCSVVGSFQVIISSVLPEIKSLQSN